MSTQIIYQRRVLLDPWPASQADLTPIGETPVGSKILVSLSQWQRNRLQLIKTYEKYNATLGIELDTTDEPAIIQSDLTCFALIKLHFSGFADGRGYSHATTLRQTMGYQGELRAVNVERDNLALLEQCGFNAFELADPNEINAALSAFDEIDFGLLRA